MTPSVASVLAQAAELTASGKPRRAINLLRPIVVARHDDAEAWCRLAEAQLAAANPDAALTAAKRGAACGGDPAWTTRLTSYALLELGRTEEAARTAREAQRLRPDDWRAHVTAALVLARREPDEALVAARHVVRLAPSQPRPHEVLAELAERTGDTPLAMRAYADARALRPGDRRPAAARPARPRSVDPLVWRDIRALAVLLAAGSLLLILAGMPTPAGPLGWFGALLLVAVLGFGWRALSRLPPPRRDTFRLLPRRHGALLVSLALLTTALAALLVWLVGMACGARWLGPLAIALPAALLAACVGHLAVVARRYRDHRTGAGSRQKGSR